ncbi:MAG: phosphoribosylglycinamide formyltransferase [Thermovirgaceae bacterium]|nr:phosphoribosylglycinamide formyltransferase [Thermovirgaceae bacterium]
MKRRIAILISGRGSNMLALARNCGGGLLNAEVFFVACDNPEAPGLADAEKLGLKTHLLPYAALGKYKAEEHLDRLISDSRAEWLILAGFMRVLSPGFVLRRRGRIVNIHPSLLPAFPGKDSIRRAFDHGVMVTGVTVHLVDEQVDHGKILAQEPVRIFPGEPIEDLEERIHQAEQILYTRTLIHLLDPSR